MEELKKVAENNELVSVLHCTLIKLNEFGQDPDSENLAQFVSDDVKQHYGVARIEEVAREMLRYCGGELPALSKKLTGLYELFNERYFDGELPPYTVDVCYVINGFETSQLWRNVHKIRIRLCSEPRMVSRLLDEMARVATTDEYGECWNREMSRLHKAGAPLVVYEKMKYLSAEEFIAVATAPPRIPLGKKAATQ